jgi:hypothetical protein
MFPLAGETPSVPAAFLDFLNLSPHSISLSLRRVNDAATGKSELKAGS